MSIPVQVFPRCRQILILLFQHVFSGPLDEVYVHLVPAVWNKKNTYFIFIHHTRLGATWKVICVSVLLLAACLNIVVPLSCINMIHLRTNWQIISTHLIVLGSRL